MNQQAGIDDETYFCVQKLRDFWLNKSTESSEGTVLDVQQGLSAMTLDVIGLAGFDYEFNALEEGETNELAAAFQGMLSPLNNVCLWIQDA